MPTAFLPSRAVLAVTGAAAREFLQGLVSNDVAKLASGQAAYAALLSPQGKFLHDFLILCRPDDAFELDCARARLPDLLARLKIYRLRSAVTFEERGQVAAGWGDAPMPPGGYADPRLPQLGWRLSGEGLEGYGPEAPYHRHRLSLGVPDGERDLTADKSLLMEFGFDELHGVDFAKGCYIGQEVTARSKHRGQVRKQLAVVRGESLPPAGAAITRAGAPAGEMRGSEGGIGLALLRREALDDGGPFESEGVTLEVSRPAWQ